MKNTQELLTGTTEVVVGLVELLSAEEVVELDIVVVVVVVARMIDDV